MFSNIKFILELENSIILHFIKLITAIMLKTTVVDCLSIMEVKDFNINDI
jgi:hypothetical protein